MAYKQNVNKRDGPKEKRKNMEINCPHCGSKMRFRGAGDSAGSRFWKCRNKRCGRTVWKRADPRKEVIPVVYEKKV